MADNQVHQVKGLKERMDSLFIFASQVPYTKDHPLPVIEACKSLIGMDLDHPPRNLLQWLDNYVKDFIPNFNPPLPSDENSSPETITYTQLGKLILNKKANESNVYLNHLLQVADPSHIAEFLLELGAIISSGKFLFCWYAFRSIQFLDVGHGYPFLYHCLSKLLEMEEGEKNNANLLQEKFALYCYQFQIRETAMIRKNKIIPHLDKMMLTIEKELNKASLPVIPVVLDRIIRTEGTKGILSYLQTLKMEDISISLIVLLDALRSALKFSDNSKATVIGHIFNKRRKNEYAE